jgi:peptidyl-prolyl cis-trans isomerase B (cyclophilin B)
MRFHAMALPLAALLVVAACSGGGSAASVAATSTSPVAAASATPASAGAPASTPDLTSCPTSQPAAMAKDASKVVTISTAKGSIAIKVEGSLSPIAAGNFVALASCGYYTGVVFHRLVPGFVIQGGDGTYGREPSVDATKVGTGGPAYTIQDEPVTADYKRGTVAMAKTTQPNSANSQFFIVLADLPTLPKDYQIFGSVTAGMDTVDAIAAMPNSGDQSGNQALQPVAMDKVTVSNP